MKRVQLVFLCREDMENFLFLEGISKAFIQLKELTLKAILSDDEIFTACSQYGARLDFISPERPHFAYDMHHYWYQQSA